MKRAIKWAIALLILGLIGAGVVRTLSTRKADQLTVATKNSAPATGVAELSATDVVKAGTRDIAQGLPISGSLKAVNSALVKTRVAGELQGLQVREGDFVTAGQVIARIESSEYPARVRQAREQAQSSLAQVNAARRQYDNNKALVNQGFISQTALDTSLASLNAAEATYRAALAGTDVAAKLVADTVLKSPISGQVSQRLAQAGEQVGVDSKIVEVVDLSRLELEASLSAQESMDVRVGQAAELQIEGSRQAIKAKVVRINPSAQAGSRSVLVYLSIDNAGSDALPLRQGLFAQGTLGTTNTPMLSVPVSAVRTDKPQPYAQVIENGVVVHKPLTLGQRGTAEGEAVVAIQGLADGALVIRGTAGALREGTQIRFTRMETSAPVPPASAQSAGKPTP